MTTPATRSRADSARNAFRYALSAVMVGIGVLHFPADELFVQIVPPVFPAPYALVWISGIIEIALGLGILFTRTRRLAGFGLVALYIAVFPANIYMALANVQVSGLPAWAAQPSPAALWLRLPFQIVFVVWALWVSEIWPRQRHGMFGAEANRSGKLPVESSGTS